MAKVHEAETRITLRLPHELHSKLTAASEANARSMNGEIVARLGASFDAREMSQEFADYVAALQQSEEIRDVQAKYIEALSGENEALKKAGVAGERIVFELAWAISKAANGDKSDLERLVEQERQQPILKRLTTVWSAVDEGK